MVNCKSVLITLLAAGVSLQAANPPQRIISTAPSLTEILFAVGLGNRVVGVTQYCSYPKEVAKIPRIGSWTTPNMEGVLAARPDLIVVQRTATHDSVKFRSVGLRTLEVKLDTVEDILAAIETIGTEGGVQQQAKALVSSIRKQLDDVRASVASRPRAAVLFIVGRYPGALEGMVAAAGSSYISEVIGIAGGRNIFADSKLGYAKIAHEEILARNPEVIVDMGEHPDAATLTEAQKRSEAALWGRYPSIKAVQTKRIHIVSNQVFIVPGPRVTELARELAKMLHPEIVR